MSTETLEVAAQAALGASLRDRRLSLDLTLESVASAVGVDAATQSRRERGEVRTSVVDLIRYAALFNSSFDEIVASAKAILEEQYG